VWTWSVRRGVQTFIGGKRHDRGPRPNGGLSGAQGHHEPAFMKGLAAADRRGRLRCGRRAAYFISLLRNPRGQEHDPPRPVSSACREGQTKLARAGPRGVAQGRSTRRSAFWGAGLDGGRASPTVVRAQAGAWRSSLIDRDQGPRADKGQGAHIADEARTKQVKPRAASPRRKAWTKILARVTRDARDFGTAERTSSS